VLTSHQVVGIVAAKPHMTMRPMARADILPATRLVYDSFRSDSKPTPNSPWFALTTKAKIALDIEQRCTPWDWSRHAQLVAQSAEGDLMGFVEVWGENERSVGDPSAAMPQPCLFNLCVDPRARRLGVARALVGRCEQECVEWGESQLFLKVRTDNEGACTLYVGQGFAALDAGTTWDGVPDWQLQWKGELSPLRLMCKSLSSADMETLERVPFRSLDTMSLDRIRSDGGQDALIWFSLRTLRQGLAPLSRSKLPAAVAIALGLAGCRNAIELVDF